jgi:hypothetical protein
LALGLIFYAATSHGQLAVNEFNSKGGFTDENGDDVDWVEVFNYSSDSVFLADYFLSDNPDNLDKWQFPNTYLGSQELITICASGREDVKFPNHWEALVLANGIWKYWNGSSPPTNYNDWNQLGFNDQSWNSGQGGIGYGDNDDNTTIAATPSILMRKEFQIVDIQDITHLLFHADYDDGFIAYLNGVEIMRSDNFASATPAYNELTTVDKEAVLYSGGIPESVFFDTESVQDLLLPGTNVLAVRVHNASASSSDMSSNFFLSAGISSAGTSYQTLPAWIVPPLVLPHAGFKLAAGETIVISDSNEVILDSVYVPADLTNTISRGRLPDGTGNWCYFNPPSPNLSNAQNTCYAGITAAPDVDLPSGWYSAPQRVLVTSPANTTSYYTANGDVPDIFDSPVTGPIYIYSSSVLSVRSFTSNGQGLPSATVDRTFIINEDNHELPVISIITDEANLWDWDSGIYVMGPNASPNYPHFGSNFWQPWSKKSRMEYFDASQQKQFDAIFDLEIHGGWSRAEPQKSFRIDAKSIYTGDIEYALIPGKPELTAYNNFNLRNGGQHGASDRIQDAVISRLAKNTSIDRMGYQACIVYLNGAYWGLYGLREKIDEHYVESNHGISSKNVDLMNWNGALAGSEDHFAATYSLLQNTPANDPNFIDLFSSRFDIDNYIDYFIFQTYIQNQDWIGIAWGLNNTKLWRPDTTGGRWRYVLYDTDAGLGHFGQNIYENYIELARNPSAPNTHSDLFDQALNNAEFKCQFTNRYDDLINTTFQPASFNTTVNELATSIEAAIPDHIAEWNSQMGPYSVSAWEYHVNNLKQYNSSRIATARQHLNQSLGLQGQHQINLESAPAQAGQIQVNSLQPELPWNGIYHGGCPVTTKALPRKGFIFSHWSSPRPAYNNRKADSIEVAVNTNTTLIAHFDSCHNVISTSISASEHLLRGTTQPPLPGARYEWTTGGHIVSTDSVIYNPTSGRYDLTVYYDSCEISAPVFSLEKEDYRLRLFPNPTTSSIQVQFLQTSIEDLSISIQSTSGQTLFTSTLHQFIGQYNRTIDLSLPSGLYVLTLQTPSRVYSEKFIVVD